MTNRVKLAISVPPEVAEAARAAVAAGEADSVSAYFAEVASTAERRKSDLAQIRGVLGEPTPDAIGWAERVLGVPAAELPRRAG